MPVRISQLSKCCCWCSKRRNANESKDQYEIDGLLSGPVEEEDQASPLTNDDIAAYLEKNIKRRQNHDRLSQITGSGGSSTTKSSISKTGYSLDDYDEQLSQDIEDLEANRRPQKLQFENSTYPHMHSL
eukprot:Platyproteum_vivax@DN5029_c0_g1_i2.p1